jgi:hypothetical protein
VGFRDARRDFRHVRPARIHSEAEPPAAQPPPGIASSVVEPGRAATVTVAVAVAPNHATPSSTIRAANS